jgi:hypothetical protein
VNNIRSSLIMTNPLYYILVQGVVTAVTIYRTKSGSPLRFFPLVFILWLAYLELKSAITNDTSRGFGNSVVGASSFLYTAQLVNLLWINSVSAADFKSPTFGSVLHAVAFNFRGIKTPWQGKNIPSFSAYYPGHIPRSRIQFLTRQVAIVIFQYLAIVVYSSLASKLTPEDKNRLLGPGVEYTYLNATMEQWLFRFIFTNTVRWTLVRCFLSILYNFVSIIGVGTGIFSPDDFPPFMGSMLNGYTLRFYWG